MTAVDRVVELNRKLRMPGQRAEPLAVIEGETAQLPLRRFQRQQYERGIDPGAGGGQPLQIFSGMGRMGGNAVASVQNHIVDCSGSTGTGLVQPRRESV